MPFTKAMNTSDNATEFTFLGQAMSSVTTCTCTAESCREKQQAKEPERKERKLLFHDSRQKAGLGQEPRPPVQISNL